MELRNKKAQSIYDTLRLFIDSHFPTSLFIDAGDKTYVKYKNQPSRLLIDASGNNDEIILYISKNLDDDVTIGNATSYILHDKFEVSGVRSGISSIMSLNIPNRNHLSEGDLLYNTYNDAHGYLVNLDSEVICVVELGKVPDDCIITDVYQTAKPHTTIEPDREAGSPLTKILNIFKK